MRALVQRVSRAEVRVDGEVVSSVGRGLCVLLGIRNGDTDDAAAWTADKVANLRVFRDGEGRMNRSLLEVGGEALVVSQFTLYGDARKGRRPSFVDAARPEAAEPLVDAFCARLRSAGVTVATGVFGAHMEVELVNDGPVTLLVEAPA